MAIYAKGLALVLALHGGHLYRCHRHCSRRPDIWRKMYRASCSAI